MRCFAQLSWMAATVALAGPVAGEPREDYPIRPVPFTDVRVEDEFWQPRLRTSRQVTIPYAFEKCEETGRVANFARAGGLEEGRFQGIYFNDSDVYKVIEGASYALALAPDAKLDRYLDGLIAKIAAAQEDDGYLYTARTLQDDKYKPPGGEERWSDIAGGHELYCVGHLYEAAVAHHRATGKRTLLDVALQNADLICRVFGPGKLTSPPGHQEIEIGLVKLYRATGDKKYLKMARFFLDARGHAEGRRLYGPYSQDHKPVVEQEQAVGHAVRAGYMYAGMADVAALTGDERYAKAIERIWQDVVGTKLYLTGGVGAAGGHEGFGPPYELPNLVAYCETCAAIANVFWNHRLFLLGGEAKYIDVLERTLYNGMLSGISLDGRSFFYPNPLESDGRHARSPWFGCACCPSNLARFIPEVPGYAYAQRGDELYVNLFLGSAAEVKLAGQTVTVRQATRYPWKGTIKIAIEPEKPGCEFTLKVRIPGWACNRPVPGDLYRFLATSDEKPHLGLNGRPLPFETAGGYATIRRTWKKGDLLELRLPMPVRRVLSHENVRENVGKVALQRGPLVYCAEWPDVPDGHVLNLLLPDEMELAVEHRPDLLGGVTVLRGKALATRWSLDEAGKKELQRSPVEITAIPYHVWAHRGRGEMAVWLARNEAAVRPLPAPTIASTSRATASGGDARALNDQREPDSSGDHSNRFLHWWPRKGTREWVQYDLAEPTRVSAVEVYWFDDTGRGECRLPASWRLLYREADGWKPVAGASGFGCEKDKYNRTTFRPIVTDGLRIEVQLPERFSAGIHEWRVE